MFVRRSEDKVRGVKTFVVVARVAFIAAIALAAITVTLSYLTATVAPKCAGREWLEGYGMRDFVGLSLVCAWVVAAVGIAALGRSKRLRKPFEDYDVPVLQLASMQVTFGMSSLITMLSMLARVTGISVIHYHAVVTHCLAARGQRRYGSVGYVSRMPICLKYDAYMS